MLVNLDLRQGEVRGCQSATVRDFPWALIGWELRAAQAPQDVPKQSPVSQLQGERPMAACQPVPQVAQTEALTVFQQAPGSESVSAQVQLFLARLASQQLVVPLLASLTALWVPVPWTGAVRLRALWVRLVWTLPRVLELQVRLALPLRGRRWLP